MWELDCEEGWAPKNWCFWTVALEKTLESPLDCKEIQSVHSEGDQPWVFFERNDAKAETPILWPSHVKSWLIGEDSDAGGEGDDRGWDGGMASLTRCTWVWVNSSSWWWTGRPGVLRFMGLQRIGHDWETELNWIYFFFLGMVLIPASCTMSQTSVHSSSGTLSGLIPWICFSFPLYNHKEFDLGHISMFYWFSLLFQFKSEFCNKEFMIWAPILFLLTV